MAAGIRPNACAGFFSAGGLQRTAQNLHRSPGTHIAPYQYKKQRKDRRLAPAIFLRSFVVPFTAHTMAVSGKQTNHQRFPCAEQVLRLPLSSL